MFPGCHRCQPILRGLFALVSWIAITPRLPATGLTILHHFTQGSLPYGQLVLAGNTLYGVTQNGGFVSASVAGRGTVFKVNTDGTGFAYLHVFSGPDGTSPIGGPAVSGSTLYGTTFQGGSGSVGTVFKVNTDGTGFAVLYHCPRDSSPNNNPSGGVVVVNNALYGSFNGGQSSFGVSGGALFRMNTDGSGLVDLRAFGGGANGMWPSCDVLISNGTIYGTTFYGPTLDPSYPYDSPGTVFGYSGSGAYTTLHTFGTAGDGTHPQGGLVQIGNALFGTTTQGGAANRGVIYRVNLDGSGYAVLHTFSGGADGGNPTAGLLAIGNTLFGVSAPTGTGSGPGTLFKLNADGSGYAVVHAFSGGLGGSSPAGGLVRNGFVLHGTTMLGGSNGIGTVFSYDLAPTANPASATTRVNTPLTLALTAATPNGFPASYAMVTSPRNGTLSGTAPNLTYTPAPDFIGSDSFTFRVNNGLTDSSLATVSLTVLDNPPALSATPAPRTINSGEATTFSVTATSRTPLTYQWTFNGVDIPGATSSNLILSAPLRAQAGSYAVTVTNGGGSIRSAPATLAIDPSRVAGTYVGGISGGSPAVRFGLFARPDRTGTLLLQIGNRAMTAQLAFDPDGFFSVVANDLSGGASAPVSVSGRVAGDMLSANAGGVAGSLNAPASPATRTGTGVYSVNAVGTMQTTAVLLIGDANVFVLLSGEAGVDSGTAPLSSANLVAVPMDNGSLTGQLDLSSGQFSGLLIVGGHTFGLAGLSDTVPALKRLANISTRGFVDAGNDVLIAGFVVQGSASKTLLVRAAGPALLGFGLPTAIARPQLQVFREQTVVAANTGWGSAANPSALASAAASVGAFGFSAGSADSAVLLNASPGPYTAVVSGVPSERGVALVEVYDLSSSGTRLVNISTRGSIGAGDRMLIAGFVVTGNAPKTLLVRAAGPALAALGLSGAITDPMLEIVQGATVVATNDNWDATARLTSATNSVGAFAFPPASRDAAAVVVLAPGQYTMAVKGVGGATGVALAEVYELP